MSKPNTHRKYIFVTGGVLSGVGKGITAAAMGATLQAKGLRVSVQYLEAGWLASDYDYPRSVVY